MHLEADVLAAEWEWALEAAARALAAGRADALAPAEAERERRLLQSERQEVAALLGRMAAAAGRPEDAWFPARPVTPPLLGLPASAGAVVLDLEGVLTDADALHAAAWAEALDPVLLRTSQELGRAFVPFERDHEYRLYFDGRPRLDGIHLFLEARGLALPGGSAADPPGSTTVRAVAARKRAIFERGLRSGRLVALPGARRYLQAAAHARLPRAVVAASTSTGRMLELAQLDHLVDVVIDAETMRTRGLRPRPAPDVLLGACGELGVAPAAAVSITHSDAGVAAALNAGLMVRAVAEAEQSERLAGFGAELVVPSLAALLDRSLRSSGPVIRDNPQHVGTRR
ncbi:MAG TPA: HAD family hydrolase [Gaiellaceae bacterium]